jgi:hypothetical protein
MFSLEFIVRAVVRGVDGAHGLAAALRQKHRYVGVLVERMSGGIVKFAAFADQRGTPVGIALIRHPLKEDELVPLARSSALDDLNIGCGHDGGLPALGCAYYTPAAAM